MKNMDYSQAPLRTEEKGKKKVKDKKLHGIKKKISKFEQEYASKSGHKPSLSDKMNNKDIKKLISEKVKIETSIQIKNEKKELKHNKKDFVNFGELFGYPENLEDATGLYEKYRIQMKRMARRSSSVISWESQSDLETIPEDRDIPLTLASPPQRIILKVTLNGGSKEDKREYAATTSTPDTGQNDGSTIGAHISMEELLAIQEQCKVERDAQRKLVKQFEREFEKETGRELTEKEKETRKENYEEYKKTKGKVRLIDALLNKMFDNHGIDSKNVREYGDCPLSVMINCYYCIDSIKFVCKHYIVKGDWSFFCRLYGK